ncbi:MAG: hypothetical protein IKK34_14430 [Clostridia bacterium]|nr:hypothetical protein [Clostridia bacterium]
MRKAEEIKKALAAPVNMSDLISRSALIEFARNHFGGEIDCNDIARFPVVDAAPVVHARWEDDRMHYRCSNCSGLFTDNILFINSVDGDLPKYCPACGAKMDGGASNA